MLNTQRSTSVINLLQALSQAKVDFGDVVKSSIANMGRYKYNYTSINVITDATEEALTKHGLLFVDSVTENGVITTLFHIASGEYMSSVFTYDDKVFVPEQQQKKGDGHVTIPAHEIGLDFQGRGKCITYGRRYNRICLLNLRQTDQEESETEGEQKPRATAATIRF